MFGKKKDRAAAQNPAPVDTGADTAGVAASAVAPTNAVTPTLASRKGVNNTARALLFGGLALMGGGLGVSTAVASGDGNDEVATTTAAPAPVTETVYVVTETVTETAQPAAGAAGSDEPVDAGNPEPTPAPERDSAQTDSQAPVSTDAAAEHRPDTYGRHSQLARGSEYRISAGDTLAGIAARSGVSTYELAQHNGIVNPDIIYLGYTIKIP